LIDSDEYLICIDSLKVRKAELPITTCQCDSAEM
jgi:hypothetical protein